MGSHGASPASVNFTPLSPISFLDRAASVHPQAVSVIYGKTRHTWQLTLQRCKRLATALQGRGITKGETVRADCLAFPTTKHSPQNSRGVYQSNPPILSFSTTNA